MSASALSSSTVPPPRSSLISSSPAAYIAPNNDALCLDSAYSGHLLIDTSCASAPTPPIRGGALEDIQPSIFDSSVITETQPWWNHLLPASIAGVNNGQNMMTPPTTLMTAEEMFATYIDPYAQFRQRLVYPQVAKQENYPDMVTPPGQLYQRYNYEDSLLELPTEIPSFPTLVKEALTLAPVKEDSMDTPPELIEAAVAALMTQPSAQPPMASPQEWNPPLSATFESDFHRPQGVVRSRSHTVGHFVPPVGWYSAAQSHVASPDQYQMSAHHLHHLHHLHQHDDEDTDVHQCQWLGCHQILPSASALTNHVNRQHIARRQPAHRCLWQGCNRADHVFRHRDKILIHIRLHTNDRPYECDFTGCGKQFSRADSLDAHKKVHSAEGKAWHCRAAGCNRTYFHAKSLKKHERTAHGLDLEM